MRIQEIERVVLSSLWRNDGTWQLDQRMDHLLAKQGVTRWVWVVGNSTDDTEWRLRQRADQDGRVTVIRHDSAVLGELPDQRLARLCETCNAAFDQVKPTDGWWCTHESDLCSPVDIVPRLLTLARDKHPAAAAGWVTLGDTDVFYDTYVYRRHGVKFLNDPPYHACVRSEPFEVDSAGSVLLFPALPLQQLGRHRGLRLTVGGLQQGGLVEWCDRLRGEYGMSVWVDPTIRIVQPTDLWTSTAFPTY